MKSRRAAAQATLNQAKDGLKAYRAGVWIACGSILGLVSAQAQLTVGFQSGTTISPSSPSIQLSVQNTTGSSIDIGGLNFYLTVGGGTTGPTIDTNPNPSFPAPGVDLLTGTIFQNNNFGQFANGTLQPRSQGWGVALSPSHPYTLAPSATALFATVTFNSFPVGGPYSLDFTQPSTTMFVDSTGANIGTTLPSGAGVTVVPEPNSALAAGVLLGLFGLWRWKRAQVAA